MTSLLSTDGQARGGGHTADSDNKISEAAAHRPSGMTKLGSHFPPFSQFERRPEGMMARRIS